MLLVSCNTDFCHGWLTVFMRWHSSVQPVWKAHCRGDDCSFTSQSPSERAWLSAAGRRTGEICVRGCVHQKWWANDFFILSTILTLNPLLHSYTHSTSITHPCPDTNRVHKELCPLQSGYCEAQACEICLWSCLGMRDYGGFSLWCSKLYVHTLADGEIHGEQQTHCWVQFQHSTEMRGPKIVEKDLGSEIQSFKKENNNTICNNMDSTNCRKDKCNTHLKPTTN